MQANRRWRFYCPCNYYYFFIFFCNVPVGFKAAASFKDVELQQHKDRLIESRAAAGEEQPLLEVQILHPWLSASIQPRKKPLPSVGMIPPHWLDRSAHAITTGYTKNYGLI